MIRKLLFIAALAAAIPANAQVQVGAPYQPSSAWPPGAGAGLDRDTPTVSARATGSALGASIYRGRVTLSRRNADKSAATSALDSLVEQVKVISGVDVRTLRREAPRTMLEPAQMQPSTPGNPLPAIPQRGQMNTVWMESVTIEVEAATRNAIYEWAAKIPPTPPMSTQQAPTPVYPIVTERLLETDPAWAQAARNAIAAAERDARLAAEASGGELGRLVGLWTERLGYVTDGQAQVSVTAEYQIAKPKR